MVIMNAFIHALIKCWARWCLITRHYHTNEQHSPVHAPPHTNKALAVEHPGHGALLSDGRVEVVQHFAARVRAWQRAFRGTPACAWHVHLAER